MEELKMKLELMSNIEYEIGENIYINDDVIKVIPDDIEGQLCDGCIFTDIFCDGMICLGNMRRDEQDVKFILT